MPQTENTHEAPRTEAAVDAEATSTSSTEPSIFAQQFSAAEGGMATDMYCPSCGEEISGSFLPVFRCPHCEILIFRDEKGNVTNYEQKHTCPECGNIFGDMTEEAPTEFRRICHSLEQNTESVFLGLDRAMSRFFS